MFGGSRRTQGKTRRASAYRWPDRIFIHPECRTKEGIWMAAQPMTRLGGHADPDEVGRTLLAALLNSTRDADVKDYLALTRERLPASGFPSESAFMKGAALVSAELFAGRLVLIPHRNGGGSGTGKGFYGLPEKALGLPEPLEGGRIGSLLLSAWELCE